MTILDPERILGTLLSGDNQARRSARDSLTPLARDAVEAVSTSIEAFARNDHSLPLVFPVVTPESIIWYACARNAAQARELGGLLTAWIGPSWSAFRGEQAQLHDTEWPEPLLKEQFGCNVFRLRLLRASDSKVVSRRIAALFSALQRKPGVTGAYLKSAGQLRAEFDRALAVGDGLRAQEVVETLRRTGRLTAENLRFVEIRMLAGLGKWDQLYTERDIRDLCELRLPPETYADLVEAVYRHYIAEHESAGDAASAIGIVQTGAFRVFAALFRTRRPGSRPAVLKSLLLWELASELPSAEACAAFMQELVPRAIDQRFRAAIERMIPTLSRGRSLASADRAFDDGKLDEAFAAYLSVEPSVQAIQGLIRCARDIETEEAAKAALAKLEVAPANIQATIEQKCQHLLRKLRATAAQSGLAIGTNWKTWLLAMQSGIERSAALESAREGARSWNLEVLLVDRESIRGFAGALTEWALTEPEFVEQLYPVLYEAFIGGDRLPRPEFRALYSALLSVVRLRPDVTRSELDLAKDVAAMCLACNPEAVNYRDIVIELNGMIESFQSYSLLDWAIDVSDELSAAACPDPTARAEFVAKAFAIAERYRLRITPLQSQMLRLLGSELGFSLSELPTAVDSSDEAPGPPTATTQARIAIYSLDSQAAGRARAALALIFPKATIEINNDTVCTDRLKNLARTADVFAFSWKTSTHQAFYCVKNHQGAATQLCLPKGSGSSSMIRSIYEKIGSETA
jgi:hypothetical protein